jgi:glycosyltransferase involved in cell wall biosynthesis
MTSITKSNDKVAVVHHSMRFWGGGQYHLRKTFDALDNAQIVTSWYFDEFIDERFSDQKGKIKTTWLHKLPFKKNIHREIIPLEPYAYAALNMDEFDTIITISDGFEKNVRLPPKKTKGKRSIMIVLTPPRFLWLETRSKQHLKLWTYRLYRTFLEKPLHNYWRWIDKRAAQRYDEVYSISNQIVERVRDAWGIESKVLYPPIPLHQVVYNGNQDSREDYYVYFGGVEIYKGIEMAVRGCIQAKAKLHVHGNGQALEPMKKLTKELNGEEYVKFMGRYEDEDKTEFLQKARGAILFAEDEDFGITFAESLAAGCPLIAYKNAGVVDIVGNVENIAVLADEYTPEAVARSIKETEAMDYDPEAAKVRGEYFSEENFTKRLREIVYGA